MPWMVTHVSRWRDLPGKPLLWPVVAAATAVVAGAAAAEVVVVVVVSGVCAFVDGECEVYFQCVHCATAYHADSGQKCVAAGSQSVSGLYIVCPRHFEPVKSNTHHSRVHTSWCCVCQLGNTVSCLLYATSAL